MRKRGEEARLRRRVPCVDRMLGRQTRGGVGGTVFWDEGMLKCLEVHRESVRSWRQSGTQATVLYCFLFSYLSRRSLPIGVSRGAVR